MPRIAFVGGKSPMSRQTAALVARSLNPRHQTLALRKDPVLPLYCNWKHRLDDHIVVPDLFSVGELEKALDFGFSIVDVNWLQLARSSDEPLKHAHWLDLQYRFDVDRTAPDVAVRRIRDDVLEKLPFFHNQRRFAFLAAAETELWRL